MGLIDQTAFFCVPYILDFLPWRSLVDISLGKKKVSIVSAQLTYFQWTRVRRQLERNEEKVDIYWYQYIGNLGNPIIERR